MVALMKGFLFFSSVCIAANTVQCSSSKDREIEELKALVDRQEVLIHKLENKILDVDNYVRDKMEFLIKAQTRKSERQITPETTAFTAYLDHKEAVHPNGVLKFNQVLYNDGNAYNIHTGIFTAPRDGTYIFTFQIEDYQNQNFSARLMVDGVHQVSAVINSHGFSTQSGNNAILGLHAGQTVWIETGEGTLYGASAFRGTTFSGALLMY